MLHGAGGTAEHGISYLRKYADELNIILLAPVSRDYSWDIIADEGFGADVIYIDQSLAYLFENYEINTQQLTIGGFSDGASYALSLGLGNGDLFTHVLAFSPGFIHTEEMVGKPKVFISHGIDDDILPINPCSRRIMRQLTSADYHPEYLEFEGRHEIPDQIIKAALSWFLQ
ncbi:alpha/beta hydrolase-fold protein [Pedobacter sp. SYSU D00535]|uniref:alpha/beta hydrolase n=1 Tax=Pedobacter sp. SYSU D00535 TaxID=2810308 RepID=UPI001F607FFE